MNLIVDGKHGPIKLQINDNPLPLNTNQKSAIMQSLRNEYEKLHELFTSNWMNMRVLFGYYVFSYFVLCFLEFLLCVVVVCLEDVFMRIMGWNHMNHPFPAASLLKKLPHWCTFCNLFWAISVSILELHDFDMIHIRKIPHEKRYDFVWTFNILLIVPVILLICGY